MKTKKLILSTALLIFTGCTANVNSRSNSALNDKNSRSGKTPGLINESISFSAGISDSSGVLGNNQIISYNNTTKSLEIKIPFPLISIIPETSGTLPQNPNIAFVTNPVEKTITLIIPLLNYIELTENPTTLPDGRPLPGVNGGEPPSFGFPLTFLSSSAYGYAAFDSFSIFVETDLLKNLPFDLNFPIKSEQNQSHIGSIYLLAPLNNYHGGVFLSFSLPHELSVLLANIQ